jgi:serine protease
VQIGDVDTSWWIFSFNNYALSPLNLSIPSLTFTWDTAVGVLGTQTLTAIAAQVPEETNLVDNSSSTTSTIVEPAAITLSVVGYKVRGRQSVDLTWSGAVSSYVDISRDGNPIATTANDSYTDSIDSRGGASYTYQVCESGTATCSNQATVIF